MNTLDGLQITGAPFSMNGVFVPHTLVAIIHKISEFEFISGNSHNCFVA